MIKKSDPMSINITFLLPNQQHIVTKQYHKSTQINQVFEDIHLSHDFFDDELLHLEWSVYSNAKSSYFGYETITLQEILPDEQQDKFIFIDSMITGLKLSNWHERAINQKFNQVINFTDAQIHELKNKLLEGCILQTCENYYESIENYLCALDINIFDEEAMLGIGGCLNNLKCSQSALIVYNLLLSLNPKHPLAHMNKGKALNKVENYKQAQESLKVALQLNPQLQSLYDDEILIAKKGLEKQAKVQQQQNQ